MEHLLHLLVVHTKMKKILLILLIEMFFLIGIISAVDWQDNPTDCPDNYQSQTCSGTTRVCGYSGGVTFCYEPGDHPTTFGLFSITGYSGDFNGGMLVDCHAYDGSVPHCDNSGAYWCDRNEATYSTEHRQTNCTGWDGSYEIGDCRSGYYNCFGDLTCEATSTSDCNASTIPHTRYTTATCNANVTEIPTAGGTCGCDPGYFNCDGSDLDGDGCEILAGGSCGSGTGTIVDDECFDSNIFSNSLAALTVDINPLLPFLGERVIHLSQSCVMELRKMFLVTLLL